MFSSCALLSEPLRKRGFILWINLCGPLIALVHVVGYSLKNRDHESLEERSLNEDCHRDLTPYSSSRACGCNLKIGVCLLSSNVLAHNHHRLEFQRPFHVGRAMTPIVELASAGK